ncbi:MAG: GTPase [Planctomycetota bacterium]
MPSSDTMIAVSSPPGKSYRGLIRISGPGVDAVLDHLLEVSESTHRRLQPVRLRKPSLPALLLRFESPGSYTGEDLAELQLPGNTALLDRITNQAIQTPDCAVRPAEPGEFTFRAYTSGKIDLTQAEGISATISAVSDSQLAAASLLRRGKLGRFAEQLVDQLGNLLALVEAGIDFTDQEDVTPILPGLLAKRIVKLTDRLTDLLNRSRSWGAIETLPRVVLVGPPSAGKSTLFNALLGRERAVIDPAPGTTRDVLTEPLLLQDSNGQSVEVMLVDLAGLDRAMQGQITLPDRVAQSIARETIDQADLLIRIAEKPDDWIDLDIDKPTVDVISKCEQGTPDSFIPTVLCVSASAGIGLEQLCAAITERLAENAVSVQADLLALQPRQEAALRKALEELRSVHQRVAPYQAQDRLVEIELLADGMREALDALAALGGQLTPDDVIGRVFSTFCVGK